ncbi:MAG: PAS domain S-box protein [Ignavibacteria bacterium]|nr:PAS domain S-box protein [Ignavibacteria bacterium]MDH7527726.1 PAS domain S-box protein [Ignavibacteria bacterium]
MNESDQKKLNSEHSPAFSDLYKNFLKIPLPVFIINRDKHNRYVLHSFNEEAKLIFALPLERLINKEIRLFWPRESWDDFRKCIVSAIRKNQTSNLDSVRIEKEGRERSFAIRVWKIAESMACCLFLETIDKSFFIQSVLNEKLKYEELFKHTPVMMTNIDLNGKIIDANLNWITKTGFEREELIGKNVKDYFIIEPNSNLALKSFPDLLVNDELKNFPVQILKKDGTFLFSVITARPLFDINGKFIRCYLVAHDISDLKSIQEEYKNVEKLLRSLLENSASAIFIYSSARGITECNNKAEELFGQKKEELIGKKIYELNSFKNLETNIGDLKSIFENPVSTYPESFNLNLSSGQQKKFFEVHITKISIKEEPLAIISILDRSLEKIKDEKIQETEKRFQTLFEESNDALKLFDNSGKILMMNKVAREYFNDYIDKGSYIQIKYKGFDYKKILLDFINSSKKSESFEYKLKTGSLNRIIKENLIKIDFENGEKLIYSISRDITREKLAEDELRKSEQNLRNLNDTKNRLIYILSHDLRAPTSSIIGIVNAILEDSHLTKEEIQNYLKLIKSASTYQLDLINNLLDWSLLESGKFNYTIEPKDLEYAVYNSLNSVKGLLDQKKIKLEIKVHSALVLIDLNLFSRILINLVSNAIKFSYPESKIWINTKLLDNSRIEISIKDNGIGIDKEVFEKLFTFKEKVSRHGTSGERGTGLGLSLCKDMVKILGGSLKIESPVKFVSKKPVGTIVSFDVKTVEPKVLISDKIKMNINLLKQNLNGYKFVRKNIDKIETHLSEDYYFFITIDEKELKESLIESLLNNYKTTKNLIVVSNNSQREIEGIKWTQPNELISFLQNEIHKIQFELDQQKSIAKQMKKYWS